MIGEIAQEFLSNWEQLAFESEQARGRIAPTSPDNSYEKLDPNIPVGPTDEERIVRVENCPAIFSRRRARFL